MLPLVPWHVAKDIELVVIVLDESAKPCPSL